MLFSSITPSALTLPDNKELTIDLFSTTIVLLSSTQALSIAGLVATGGNTDGMVVCFSNVNTSAFALSFLHESSFASAVTNRFRCANSTSITVAQYGAVSFRYSSFTSRWQAFSKV